MRSRILWSLLALLLLTSAAAMLLSTRSKPDSKEETSERSPLFSPTTGGGFSGATSSSETKSPEVSTRSLSSSEPLVASDSKSPAGAGVSGSQTTGPHYEPAIQFGRVEGHLVQDAGKLGKTSVPMMPGARLTAVSSGKRRSGLAFPIGSKLTEKRYNVQLLTNYWIPPAIWSDPDFRKLIQTDVSGRFPVRVWRLRGATALLVDTIFLPARYSEYLQYNVRAGGAFDAGDVLVLEYTPGMFVAPGADASIPVAIPFASEIDNRSNDAVTIYPVHVDFEGAQ